MLGPRIGEDMRIIIIIIIDVALYLPIHQQRGIFKDFHEANVSFNEDTLDIYFSETLH